MGFNAVADNTFSSCCLQNLRKPVKFSENVNTETNAIAAEQANRKYKVWAMGKKRECGSAGCGSDNG